MAQALKVVVERYDPDRSPAAFLQQYEIEPRPSMTALELLVEIQSHVDDTLAFRRSCQIGKCGSCAVSLDGAPVLACRTVVGGSAVRIGALPGFPVVKDLIVDRQRFEEKRARLVAARMADSQGGGRGAAIPDASIAHENVARCIGCLVCDAACPVAAQAGERFTGPALLPANVSSGVRSVRNGASVAPVDPQTDYCSLCMNCRRACPSGVALNRLNAQGKQAWAQTRGLNLRDRLIGRVELMGRLGSLVPGVSNLALRNALVRRAMEAGLGISRSAGMVEYASPFRRWYARHANRVQNPKHKVAYFVGCYNSYSDTRPARDAVTVLEHLGIQVILPEQRCCGMPLIGNGDLEGARQRAVTNLAALMPLVQRGYDIVATCTSCSLMLKREYGEVLRLPAAGALAGHVWDLGEYLLRLADAGELDGRSGPVALRAAYHTPCHLRAQEIGLPFVELLSRVAEVQVAVLDAKCCGLSGSYGYKAEKRGLAQTVGQQLVDALKREAPDLALSECGICQTQMRHGAGVRVGHPVSVLRNALLQKDGE